jgi:hypothetical protein
MSPAANTAAAEVSGARGELHVRRHAGADPDRFGRQLETAARDHALDALGAVEALELVLAVHGHAVRSEQLFEEAPDARAEAALQRVALLHHDRRPFAELAHRGGDLAADVGAADQDDLLRVLDPRADRVRVAERPQVVDLLEMTTLDVQASHVGSRRKQRRAELDLLLARQLRGARVEVERCHARAKQQFDVLLRPPLGRAEVRLFALLLAAQVALRALGAVVRRIGLAPDERDRPLRALLAQPARAVRRREAAADQQVVDLAVGHGRTLQPRWVAHRPSRPRRGVIEHAPTRAVFAAVGTDVGAGVAGVEA